MDVQQLIVRSVHLGRSLYVQNEYIALYITADFQQHFVLALSLVILCFVQNEHSY